MQNNEPQPEYEELKPQPQMCSICHNDVYPDGIIGGVPDCVTCANGHFLHRQCYNDLSTRICPTCRSPTLKYNCRGAYGYIQLKRKGGKRRKTVKKKKTLKRRKSVKKRRRHRK